MADPNIRTAIETKEFRVQFVVVICEYRPKIFILHGLRFLKTQYYKFGSGFVTSNLTHSNVLTRTTHCLDTSAYDDSTPHSQSTSVILNNIYYLAWELAYRNTGYNFSSLLYVCRLYMYVQVLLVA